MRLTLLCLSPIHHGSFDRDGGTVVPLRRLPVVLPEGGIVQVPCISGNAIRGVMRRLLMREMLAACDISAATMDPHAYERLYAVLANGGHLEGSESSVVPAERAALRTAIPPLSAFGAMLYSYPLEGTFEAPVLYPVCGETTHLTGAIGSILAEDLVTEWSHVRLPDRDQQDPEATGVGPMPTTMEVLIPGTVLVGTFGIRRCTAIEASAVAHAASMVTHVGGKIAAGLGRVRPDVEGDGGLYVDWLDAHLSQTKTALRALAERLAPSKKKVKAPKKDKAPNLLDLVARVESEDPE